MGHPTARRSHDANESVYAEDNVYLTEVVTENGAWHADLKPLGYDIDPDSQLKAHASDSDGDTTVRFDPEDIDPPFSEFFTQHGDIVAPLVAPVRGQSTEWLGYIESVSVRFQPLEGSAIDQEASLDCSWPASPRCTCLAYPPLIPGVYQITAHAVDSFGNVEQGGVAISVIVV